MGKQKTPKEKGTSKSKVSDKETIEEVKTPIIITLPEEEEEVLLRIPLTELEYEIAKIVVKSGNIHYPLYLRNIIGIEGDRNYVWIYLKGLERIKVRITLKMMKALLAIPHFITVHDSYIANIHFFTGFDRRLRGSSILYLIQGIEFMVSQDYVEEVYNLVYKDAIVVLDTEAEIIKGKKKK